MLAAKQLKKEQAHCFRTETFHRIMKKLKLYISGLFFLLTINLICQNCITRNDTVYCDDPLDSKNYIFLGKINSNFTDKYNFEKNIQNKYNITSIGSSTNEIEIRYVREFHEEESSMITLIYNQDHWKYNYQFADYSKEKENNIKKCKNDTTLLNSVNNFYNQRDQKRLKYEKTKKIFNLDSLFRVLAINNIFDQSNEMTKNEKMYSAYNKLTNKIEHFNGGHSITDGRGCTVFFKIFDLKGNYDFSNVDSYYDMYPNNKKLSEQIEIFKIFEFISNQ
jgi:hypothetical protein